MAKQMTVKLRIEKEDDRRIVAGILAKQHGVKFGSDYKTTAAGKKSTAKEYFLLVDGVEEGAWE